MIGKMIAIARHTAHAAHTDHADHDHHHDHAHHHAEHAAEEKMQVQLTRRELLKGTGLLVGTLALSSTLAMVAPSRVWAAQLQHLNTHQGAVLLAASKQIFPHKNLDDAVYALLVKALDGKAAKDRALRKQLVDGIRELDRKAPGSDWTRQSADAQLKDLQAIETTPFFQTIRSTGIVALYSNALAYKHFGYRASEGDGGYLYSGFNDLAWLPNPPDEDSGPIPAQ